MSVRPWTPGDGEPISATFSDDVRRESLLAAQDFVKDFDINTIDPDKATGEYLAEQTKNHNEKPDPKERGPIPKGTELELEAMTSAVVDRMRAELAAQGLDIRSIDITSSWTCGK